MSLSRLRDEYHVPCYLGARVQAQEFGEDGEIVGCHDDHISVLIDGLTNPIYIHPTDLTYYPTTKG